MKKNQSIDKTRDAVTHDSSGEVVRTYCCCCSGRSSIVGKVETVIGE